MSDIDDLVQAARELADTWSHVMEAPNTEEHVERMNTAVRAVYAALKKYETASGDREQNRSGEQSAEE